MVGVDLNSHVAAGARPMFDPTTLVGFHTWLSLIAMAVGIYVVAGLIGGRREPGWTAIYLITAVATSATGFLFPFSVLLPSHIVGVLSLIVLVAAILGRYIFGYAGAWRWLYVLGIVIGEYFLVFVGVAQSFGKIPALAALAPTQSEPPFAIAQAIVLAIFVWLSIAAVRGFHPTALSDASPSTAARARP
jgi:hypothetical protein